MKIATDFWKRLSKTFLPIQAEFNDLELWTEYWRKIWDQVRNRSSYELSTIGKWELWFYNRKTED